MSHLTKVNSERFKAKFVHGCVCVCVSVCILFYIPIILELYQVSLLVFILLRSSTTYIHHGIVHNTQETENGVNRWC